MTAALDGTGEFAGLSHDKRTWFMNMGMLSLITLYASHELESAIAQADEMGPGHDSSGHSWDKGWAFYYGSLDGSYVPIKVAIWRDPDFPDGIQVATETGIVRHFNKGLISVRDG